MSKATLYLMVGYPGSGKTTTAKIIHELTGAEHVWADKERHERFGEVYRQADSDELYRILNDRTAQLLQAGKSVVFDTNFNYRKDRDSLRQIATEAGATPVVLWLQTPKETAFHRAVTQTNGQRMFVSMTHDDFERVASHLEAPGADEHPIVLDGTHVTAEYVKQNLGL
ncbi:MAG TPA: ATP-binding protein [Candidatus Saccharimonadales bacterium]|nr:ATP-binding protein [Candidatus Saccharimonadales bacterium]